MKIAVDAMGGDHAPQAVVEGALQAEPQCPADLVLIGDEERLRAVLSHAAGEGSSVEVIHAAQTIGMEDSGPVAVRRKRDASLSVAMRLLAAGHVDAVVSAGNSSAIVATAKHFVGLLPGLRRPAMAVPIPTLTGSVLLLDAGAHVEANAIQLAHSAVLAHAYLKVSEGLNHPRVGLLNIGHEPAKGLKVVQRAFTLLKRTSIGFSGNVEPQDIFLDRVDAAITDGFIGNVVLKMHEGVSETVLRFFDAQLTDEVPQVKEAVGRILERFKQAYHYQNVGGAPLLGVTRPVVVAHGRSQAPAVANAVMLAWRLAEERVFERLAKELELDSGLADLKHLSTIMMLEGLRPKWGFGKK